MTSTRLLNLEGKSRPRDKQDSPSCTLPPIGLGPLSGHRSLGASLVLTGCHSYPSMVGKRIQGRAQTTAARRTVADDWLDAADESVVSEPTDYSYWWAVFQDPVLDELVDTAYQENLTLKIACQRIIEARPNAVSRRAICSLSSSRCSAATLAMK